MTKEQQVVFLAVDMRFSRHFVQSWVSKDSRPQSLEFEVDIMGLLPGERIGLFRSRREAFSFRMSRTKAVRLREIVEGLGWGEVEIIDTRSSFSI